MSEALTSQLQEWISRINAGESKAREELLTHTRGRLLRIAHRMLHGRHVRLESLEQTDDVVQDLYVRLLGEWDRFFVSPHPITTVPEYFFRAAGLMRNVLIDLGRKHFGRQSQRHRALSIDANHGADTGSDAQYDPSSDTDDPAEISLWTAFHEEVERLPEDLRAVVDLRWYHDLPHQDIAELLGVAEVTVRGRWAKARLRLSEKFQGSPFDWSSFN
jgi:RNA polymerase sigma factor (sigma-70 family)